MERTKVFNNNGVDVLSAGYVEEANDLFRAALETKLAHDRAEIEGCTDASRCVTPECVFLAEYHMNNKRLYMKNPKRAPGNLSLMSNGGFLLSRGIDENNKKRSPSAYLYSKAFSIEDAHFEKIQYASALNIFNLGLVHHLDDPSCNRARSFYEVAASLLAIDPWDEESSLLRAALTSNFAVWAYENGEMAVSRAALVELGRMVIAWPGKPEHRAGFQLNLSLLQMMEEDEEDDEEEECDVNSIQDLREED